ncbi:MFS transporter [Saccharopolyspora rosea]|uniref:MFS transporter n=1 Tax=Saccharopolyspora rosea TaxID=524884 RepID=A0ABW3FN00_9PSEU|nr:MFS transporter [Saccharopolyspora rosea]
MPVPELVRPAPPPTRPGLALPRPAAFACTGVLLGLFLVGSTTPSPMYALYQQRWHFSAIVLTEVFAVYAVAILAALLLFGSLSDHVGRRPVLLAAVVVEIVAMAALGFAPNVGWLFAGRVLQGLATGVATSAISGALLDFQPPGSNRGPLVNGVASGVGMAVGSVLAGALVQYAPGPTLTSYLVLIAAFALSLLGVLAMPEPVPHRRPLRDALRPQRPTVPAGRGRTFALLATTMLASWTVGGMFMSLGPSVAKGLVADAPYVVGGLTVAALAGVGGITQLVLSSWSGRRAVRVAAPLMIAGLAGVAASVLVGSAAVFFAAAVVLGVGWGLMFMGGFRMLTGLATPEHRAGTSAMIYVVAYLSASVPSVALGTVSTVFGLTAATLAFAITAAAFSLVAALATLGHR